MLMPVIGPTVGDNWRLYLYIESLPPLSHMCALPVLSFSSLCFVLILNIVWKRGKKRMYRLGAYIRRRYEGFLGDSPREVHARSSAADRCLESVSLVLASLYKPEGRYPLIIDWIRIKNWHKINLNDEMAMGSEFRTVMATVSYSNKAPTRRWGLSSINCF